MINVYEIENIIKHRNFSQDIYVEEFESKLAATLKVNPEQVVVVSSGTAALMIAVKIIDPYKVTMPASTFIATGNVFAEKFIDIEYLDINKDTWNASDAMVSVDMLGNPIENSPLIEDAAQALGSKTKDNRMCGTLGRIGILSFFANKIITSGGEGGAIICKYSEDAYKARLLRQQGKDYTMNYPIMLGYNYRMTEIQAAIGLDELSMLDDKIIRHREIFNIYTELLPELQFQKEVGFSNRWMTVVKVENLQQVISALEQKNLWYRRFFRPLYYNEWLRASCKLENSEDLWKKGLCLPSDVSNDIIEKTCEVILTCK